MAHFISCSRTLFFMTIGLLMLSLHAAYCQSNESPLTIIDVSEREYAGSHVIALTFSQPLANTQTLTKNIGIHRKGEGRVIGQWALAQSRKRAFLANTEPSSDYSLTVKPELTAKSGAQLELAQSFSIKTRAITPSVSFKTQGTVIQAGSDVGLPLAVMNVDEVDIDFHRVKPTQYLPFLQSLGKPKRTSTYQLRNATAHTDFLFSDRYKLDIEKNRLQMRTIAIQDREKLQEPGLYLAVIRQPGSYGDYYHLNYFTVTDIGIHLRNYRDGLDVYAQRLDNGEPMANVNIQLLDRKGNVKQEKVSNTGGKVTFFSPGYPSINDGSRLLMATQGKSTTLLNLQQASLDLSEFALADRPARALELFVYSERDLYRPGDTLRLSALYRNHDGQGHKDGSTHRMPLRAEIIDATGKTIKILTLPAQAHSYYQLDYPLPRNAATGRWRVRFKGGSQQAHEHEFHVEAFLPERLQLTFDPPRTAPTRRFSANEPLFLTAQADYLYGAPAAGNRFEAEATLRFDPHPLSDHSTYHDYHFGNIEQADSLTQRLPLEANSVSDDGSVLLSVPRHRIRSETPIAVSPLRLDVQASVFESGGRPVTRTHTSLLWPQKTLVGIRLNDGDNPEANSTANFSVGAVDKTGALHELNHLTAQLIREETQYFWVYSEQRGWHYDTTDKAYAIANLSIDLNEQRPTKFAFDVEWGSYRVEVLNAKGQVLSSARFHAGENWYHRWQNHQDAGQAARPDKVSLAWNQSSFVANDAAVLSVIPPHAGKSLVLVESDRLLWSQWLEVPEDGAQVSIPIDPKWDQHNIYATVIHLQDEQGKSSHRKRSLGMIHLPLNRRNRQLKVSLDTPTKVTPNQTLSVPVQVTGVSTLNQPVYLTLAAVDVGILNITDFQTPDPFRFFFEPRRNSVFGSDMYQKLIESSEGPLAKRRSGGDAALSRGGREAQAEVNIVSLFSGLVQTDADGKARVPLEIPNFNGRLRLMVVAFDDQRFGSEAQEMTVAAPITAEIAMPRFLASGDQTTATLDLHNLTEATQQIELEWWANQPLTLDKQSQSITLKPQEKRILSAPLSASYPTGNLEWQGKVNLSLSAQPAQASNATPVIEKKDSPSTYQLTTHWPINLRHPYPAVIRQANAILAPGESFTLDPSLLRGLEMATTDIQLSYSSHADFQAQSQFDQLLAYPYGCLEQTASSTFPWILAQQQGYNALGLTPIDSKQQSDALAHGLERLAERRRLGGGFGLWSSNDAEEHWLTAYVGELLWFAREQGFAVDNEMYQATLKRLDRYYRNRYVGQSRWSQNPEHYTFAYQAYAGYVLALNGRARLSLLRTLAKQQTDAAQSPLPLVHLAIATQLAGDAPLANQLLEKALNVTRSSGYLGDYGSDIRDTALIIDLLLRHNIKPSEAHALSFDLADNLRQRRYLSTQERNALFRAAISLAIDSQTTAEVEVTLGQQTNKQSKNARVTQSIQGDQLQHPVIITHLKQSPADALQTSIDISGYSSQPPPAVSKGYRVEKRFLNRDGNPISLTKVVSGDLVIVELVVHNTGKRARPDTLVVDLLPAGLEIENANLKHSTKLDMIKVDGVTILEQQAELTHSEARDDRFVAALQVGTYRPSRIYYLARAVTPGRYALPPTLVEDMYAPEVRALGNAEDTPMMVIKPTASP